MLLLETDFWQVEIETELVGGQCRRDKLGSSACLGELIFFWKIEDLKILGQS